MHEQSWDASAKTMHGKVVDNLMFVVGGLNGFTTTYNMECYDKTTEAWYDAHDKGIFWCALSRCLLPGVPNVVQDAPQSPKTNQSHPPPTASCRCDATALQDLVNNPLINTDLADSR
ncbi:hypothetical protein P4O66_011718 [Electrophorus voltai]|uniref:Uncharacterized protein n=1 Tax=Electrophorus voltai TaxID=2609070 RepID=A0AAD8Z560_9TELE|nr:hypothetical protein P4O66_011718 [Electrophorus voltai]